MPQTVGTPRVAGFARVGRRVGQGFSEVPIFPQIAKKRHDFMQNRVSFGAATQIRCLRCSPVFEPVRGSPHRGLPDLIRI